MVSSHFPPRPLGQWREVRGEKRGCKLLQERSWCWRSPCPAMQFHLSTSSFSSSPPAHLAAPRTLIWRENKNVFISQERRRTLEWNHRVKAQKGILGPHTGCCGAIFSPSTVSLSALIFNFKVHSFNLILSSFVKFQCFLLFQNQMSYSYPVSMFWTLGK